MQYQVPQFIDVEDKIVGPLSLRQFLYISGAICLIMILYFVLTLWLWIVLAILIGGGAAALALVKVNGRPLTRLALSALQFYWQPQTYVWLPSHPNLPKNEDTLRGETEGLSLDRILSGMALKSAWQHVQVGTKATTEKVSVGVTRAKERYEVLERISGDRRAAKRVDYH